MAKRILTPLILLSLIVSLISCGSEEFSHAELVISLPSGFSMEDSDSYDIVMRDGDVTCAVLRISLYAAETGGIPDNLSPFGFAEYTLSERGSDGEVFTYKDIPYFSEYSETSGRKFYTLYTFYRSKNAYFIVSFSAPRSKEENNREKFLEYADTVKFTD